MRIQLREILLEYENTPEDRILNKHSRIGPTLSLVIQLNSIHETVMVFNIIWYTPIERVSELHSSERITFHSSWLAVRTRSHNIYTSRSVSSTLWQDVVNITINISFRVCVCKCAHIWQTTYIINIYALGANCLRCAFLYRISNLTPAIPDLWNCFLHLAHLSVCNDMIAQFVSILI